MFTLPVIPLYFKPLGIGCPNLIISSINGKIEEKTSTTVNPIIKDLTIVLRFFTLEKRELAF